MDRAFVTLFQCCSVLIFALGLMPTRLPAVHTLRLGPVRRLGFGGRRLLHIVGRRSPVDLLQVPPGGDVDRHAAVDDSVVRRRGVTVPPRWRL